MPRIKEEKKFGIKARAVRNTKGIEGIFILEGESKADRTKLRGLVVPFTCDDQRKNLITEPNNSYFYGSLRVGKTENLDDNYKSGRLPSSVSEKLDSYWDRNNSYLNPRRPPLVRFTEAYRTNDGVSLKDQYFKIPFSAMVNQSQMSESNRRLINYVMERLNVEAQALVKDLEETSTSEVMNFGKLAFGIPLEIIKMAVEKGLLLHANSGKKTRIVRKDDLVVADPAIFPPGGTRTSLWARY